MIFFITAEMKIMQRYHHLHDFELYTYIMFFWPCISLHACTEPTVHNYKRLVRLPVMLAVDIKEYGPMESAWYCHNHNISRSIKHHPAVPRLYCVFKSLAS